MKRFTTLWTALALLLAGCATQPIFKGTPWEKYESAEAAGFDQAKLDEVTEYIRENAATTGLLAVCDGRVVYEYGDLEVISYIASCRKSVLSMLFGKYVDDGTIDLDVTIGELGMDEDDGLLPIEKQATIDHIITSRSGVFHLPSNGGYDTENIKERGSKQPGEYFVYNNWDFNAAGYIFEHYAGRSIYAELEDQLARPLGFQDWNIKNQRKYHNEENSRYPAYHIFVSTRDMAKIGQLMLNRGMWNGRCLISEEWFEKSTATVTPTDTVMARYGGPVEGMPDFSYSYMWWNFDEFNGDERFEGSISARGYGGQYITVIPGLSLVIAHKTKLSEKNRGTSTKTYFEIIDRIVKAKIT